VRRFGERYGGPATIAAAVAIGVIWLAALLVLSRKPPSPPLGPARAAPVGEAQGPRLRGVPQLPARIAPDRRHVTRKPARRRVRRPAPAVVRPRATAPPVATARPTPVAATPAPSAAPPPAPAPPAQPPARPKPRHRAPPPGQTFDSSG
jgi:hypothetical protein